MNIKADIQKNSRITGEIDVQKKLITTRGQQAPVRDRRAGDEALHTRLSVLEANLAKADG